MRTLAWALLAFLVACGGKSKGGGDAAPAPTDDAGDQTDGAADASDDGTDDGTDDGAGTDDGGGAGTDDGAVGDGTGGGSAGGPFDLPVEPTQASVQSNLVNTHCVPCHQGATPAGQLDLTDLGRYLTNDGGLSRDERFLIVRGHPELSLIVRAIVGPERPMPPTGNPLDIPAVSPAALSALENWILSLPQ